MYDFPRRASNCIFLYRFTIAPLTNDTENKFFRDIITYINTPITSWKQIKRNQQIGGSVFIILSYEVHTRTYSRFHRYIACPS